MAYDLGLMSFLVPSCMGYIPKNYLVFCEVDECFIFGGPGCCNYVCRHIKCYSLIYFVILTAYRCQWH